MIGDRERRRAAMAVLLWTAEHDVAELGADLRAIRYITPEATHAARPDVFASVTEAYNALYLLATSGQVPVAQADCTLPSSLDGRDCGARFRIRAAWYEIQVDRRRDQAVVDRLTSALARQKRVEVP